MKTNNVAVYIILFIFVLGLLAFPSLLSKSVKERMFTDIYPSIPMKGYLKLVSSDNDKEKPGYGGNLRVIGIENISEQVIRIPLRSDHQLITYNEEDHEWLPVKEQTIYRNDREMILYPQNDYSTGRVSFAMLSTQPTVDPQEKPVEIRLVLIGEIVENDQPTGEKIGGYLDIVFRPTKDD